MMKLPIASYAEQNKTWPQAGRHILAQFDTETIVVYQAYAAAIGEFAIEHGCFGGEFKYSRMSWIKPNFLWMMYRSNWGQSEGQEVVLGIRLRRSFFDSLLDQAVPSAFNLTSFTSQHDWACAVEKSDVRLQWDPDHLPTGEKCERRAIQLGLRGAALESYGKREIIEVIDMSEFVAQQRPKATNWTNGELQTPVGQVYVPSSENTAFRLELDR
jgi:hypothetical protein